MFFEIWKKNIKYVFSNTDLRLLQPLPLVVSGQRLVVQGHWTSESWRRHVMSRQQSGRAADYCETKGSLPSNWRNITWAEVRDHRFHGRTRRSAVAVIADRTAYDARYIGKLSNRFRLQVYEGWYARSDSTGRVYERTKLSSLKRDWPKFTNSVTQPMHPWLYV